MKSKKQIQTTLDQTRIMIGTVVLLLVVLTILFVRQAPVEAPVAQSPASPDSAMWTCPVTAWVRCPSNGSPQEPECKEGFLPWARAKCPGFEGIIYYVSP